MNQDIKQKWVAALRSGEYKQGVGMLKLRDGDDLLYCCLGVLCDITHPDGWLKLPASGPSEVWEQFGNTAFVPWEIRREVGATESELWPLVDMNDRRPSDTFAQIADYIEENL